MNTSALIFPQTVLRRSTLAALSPLFAPLMVLEPHTLSPEQYPQSLLDKGLIQVLRPAGEPDPAQVRQVEAMIRQWGDWSEQAKGSSELAALKSGLKLPPEDPENLDAIRKDVREYGAQAKESDSLPPEARADLLLHLAHAQDQEAAQMEGLLGDVTQGGRRLGQVMGLEEEDAEPLGLDSAYDAALPPVAHSLDGEHPMGPRLQAWANLAGRVEIQDAWLATASPPAVAWLMERANQRLLSNDKRSPAGASQIIWPPKGAGPESPLAQEALRMELPSLKGLDEEGLLALTGRMAEDGSLGRIHTGLAGLLSLLSGQRWSSEVSEQAVEQAQSLAADLAQSMGPVGRAMRSLSLVVFPGLTRDQVLGLMSGDEPTDLPPLSDRPRQWPQTSCVVAVAW